MVTWLGLHNMWSSVYCHHDYSWRTLQVNRMRDRNRLLLMPVFSRLTGKDLKKLVWIRVSAMDLLIRRKKEREIIKHLLHTWHCRRCSVQYSLDSHSNSPRNILCIPFLLTSNLLVFEFWVTLNKCNVVLEKDWLSFSRKKELVWNCNVAKMLSEYYNT